MSCDCFPRHARGNKLYTRMYDGMGRIMALRVEYRVQCASCGYSVYTKECIIPFEIVRELQGVLEMFKALEDKNAQVMSDEDGKLEDE